MTISTHPAAIQAYRNDTKERVAHAGVMSPTFKCRTCKGYKKTSGRQRIFNGYRCADCCSKREVRDENGAQKETAASSVG